MKYLFYALVSLLILTSLMIFPMLLTESGAASDTTIMLHERHMVLLTHGAEEPFWRTLKAGAEIAGDEEGMTVEVIDLPPYDPDRMLEAIDHAILANADALALQPIEDPRIAEALNRAVEKGLIILTFENDAFTLEGIPTVGSNSYNIGQSAAKLAIEASDGKAQVAILLNGKGLEDSRYKSLKLQGFIEQLASQTDMSIAAIYTIDTGLFEADLITRKVLNEHPEVNLIICTDEKRTPGVAQVIVENNAVGDIQIIGFGNMDQTMQYIEKGVIYGTICADGFEIGNAIVRTIKSLAVGNPVSESKSTPIYTYTLDNLDAYDAEFGDVTSQP